MEEQLVLFLIIGIITTNSLHGKIIAGIQQPQTSHFTSSTNNTLLSNLKLTSADQVLRVNVPEGGYKRPLKKSPTYFILASNTVRPSHSFRIIVHILESSSPVTVDAVIYRNNVKISQVSESCHVNAVHVMTMKMPASIPRGTFKLRVEGSLKDMFGVTVFSNETYLHYSSRSLNIIIQTDQLIYHQGQTVKFRVFPFGIDLKAFKEPVDIFMLDPNDNVVQKWLTHRTDLAVANLSYVLPHKVIAGSWTIRVIAQEQIEEKKYTVKEYYPSAFEVEVVLPLFVMDQDNAVSGYVQANYTDGGAVSGNLTILVSLSTPCIGCDFNSMHTVSEQFIPSFEGIHYIHLPLGELTSSPSHLVGKQVTVRAKVGDMYFSKIIEGFASTLIKPTELAINFLGPQVQIFKPSAPVKIYIGAFHSDGSPISQSYLRKGRMELRSNAVLKTKQIEAITRQDLNMLFNYPGVWESELDLLSEPLLKRKLYDVKMIRLEAVYKHPYNKPAFAKISLFPQISPHNHHLSISTSTKIAKVGEFVIFHVR